MIVNIVQQEDLTSTQRLLHRKTSQTQTQTKKMTATGDARKGHSNPSILIVVKSVSLSPPPPTSSPNFRINPPPPPGPPPRPPLYTFTHTSSPRRPEWKVCRRRRVRNLPKLPSGAFPRYEHSVYRGISERMLELPGRKIPRVRGENRRGRYCLQEMPSRNLV